MFQIGISIFGLMLFFNNSTKVSRKLANVNDSQRIFHARELLGQKYFDNSPVVVTEGYRQINKFILQEVEKSLPEKFKKKAFRISQTIISEANKLELDPLFIMAVIRHESKFNPEALGGVGEIGLMQIRPEHGKWLAEQFGIKWRGKKSLLNPETNIKIGVHYMSHLREMFGHGRLYLSAYNMGPTKLRNSLARNYWPRVYSSGVMKQYMNLNKALATKINIERVSASKVVALQERPESETFAQP